MQLKLNPEGCEFCNGTVEVRICSGLRSTGEACKNRVCKKLSYGTSTDYILPGMPQIVGSFRGSTYAVPDGVEKGLPEGRQTATRQVRHGNDTRWTGSVGVA